MRAGLLLAAALATLALAASAGAQDVENADGFESFSPSRVDHDTQVNGAFQAYRQGEHVRARELAEGVLRSYPTSPAAHGILGIVLFRSEGSLPRALYHLERSRSLYLSRIDAGTADAELTHWHRFALHELAQVNGAMGNDEEKIALLEELELTFGERRTAEFGWPLMRLRRYAEAREKVAAALATGDRGQQIMALNALCAIEGEQQHRAEMYVACLRSAELDRELGEGDPVAYTNAAIAALAVLRLDQAERLIQEGSERFASGTVANPWLDLMQLYVAEGRTAEALEAMREMFTWRIRQPPYMDEQNRAQTQVASAIFLLVAGRPIEAARIATRSVERPDRTGFTSSNTEQMQSAAALVDTIANRTAAEVKAERASYAPFPESLRERVASWRHRFDAWTSARRAAALLARERILLSSVRPYLPGGSETPEWVKREMPAALGTGVLRAAVARAREIETLPEAEGYFLSFECRIAWLDGDAREAVEIARRALEELPGAEALLRGQVAATAALAAEDSGDLAASAKFWELALQIDPGLVRRMGASLPVRFSASEGPVAREAADHLRDSPRLAERGGAFVVQIDASDDRGEACLIGPNGVVVNCARVTPRAGDTPDVVARRLAAGFHDEVFAPRIDLTQSDLRSLDGSTTAAGGRSKERLRTILDQMVGPEE